VITATELSDAVDMTRQGVNNRLSELVESGHLRSKQVGSRAVVYWLTEEGRELASEG
jgi:predicted transcriptional regulator